MTFIYGLLIVSVVVNILMFRALNEAKEYLEWCLDEFDRLDAIIAEREKDEKL